MSRYEERRCSIVTPIKPDPASTLQRAYEDARSQLGTPPIRTDLEDKIEGGNLISNWIANVLIEDDDTG